MKPVMSNLRSRLAALAACLPLFAAHALAASPQEELVGAVTVWVAAQNNTGTDLIKVMPLDPRIQVQPCQGKTEFDFPFANRSTVRARCTQPNWQLFIKLALSQPIHSVHSVVTSRAVPAGQALTAEDLEIRPEQQAMAGGFKEREPLIGRALKRAIAKGQPVLAQDLETGQQVYRLKQSMRAGDLITAASAERVTMPREAVPAAVWMGTEIPPGSKLAKDAQAGKILLTSDFAQARQVVVATGNLVAGQQIKSGMVKLVPLEQDKINRANLFDLAGVEGFELTRAVMAGEAIRSTDLRPALMIKRGELVIYSIGRPSQFEVSIKLEALQDGRLGEHIRMRNNESGRTLSGVVTGLGTVSGS